MADEILPPTDADAPPPFRAPIVELDVHRERRAARGSTPARPAQLPHDLVLEQSILGGIFLKPSLLREDLALETDDFYDPRHRAIWSAFVNLDADGFAIDVATVESELDRAGKLDAVGGLAYLGELALKVPIPDNVRFYAERVREHAEARRLVLEAHETIDGVLRGRLGAEDAAARIVTTAQRLVRTHVRHEPGTWEHDLAMARLDVRRALVAAKVAETRAPMFDDIVSLLRADFPETSWLATGLITRGGVTIIGAEPKASKTWLGTEIAIAIATGTPVCGEFYAAAGRVAYFYAEDLARQIRNRVRALLAGTGRSIAAGRFFPQPRGKFLDLTVDDDLAWIVASVRRIGQVDALVLDPLRDLHSAEEDKSDAMRDVMRRLRLLGELLGCTVIVVHHAVKMGADTAKRRPGQRLRGSSAIHGSVDSGIYLSDVDADDPNTLINTVDSELKGARGAGHFTLTLRIEDDDNGEAVRATWEVDREERRSKRGDGEGATPPDDKVEAACFAMLGRLDLTTEPVSKEDLRKFAACNATVAREAMRRLEARGQLVKVDRKSSQTSRHHLLWTPAKANEHQVRILTSEGV